MDVPRTGPVHGSSPEGTRTGTGPDFKALVKYPDIAPLVGLNHTLEGNDMKTFDIDRARIPTPLFKKIVEDLDIAMYQYGDPIYHNNEEARLKCISKITCFWRTFPDLCLVRKYESAKS